MGSNVVIEKVTDRLSRRSRPGSKEGAPGNAARGTGIQNERHEWRDFKSALDQYHAALGAYRGLTENCFKLTNNDGRVADIEIISEPSIGSLVVADKNVKASRLHCARTIVALQEAFSSGEVRDQELYRQAATHDTPLLTELRKVEARYFGGPLIGNLPIYISDAELNELLDLYSTFALVRQQVERIKARQEG